MDDHDDHLESLLTEDQLAGELGLTFRASRPLEPVPASSPEEQVQMSRDPSADPGKVSIGDWVASEWFKKPLNNPVTSQGTLYPGVYDAVFIRPVAYLLQGVVRGSAAIQQVSEHLKHHAEKSGWLQVSAGPASEYTDGEKCTGFRVRWVVAANVVAPPAQVSAGQVLWSAILTSLGAKATAAAGEVSASAKDLGGAVAPAALGLGLLVGLGFLAYILAKVD